ncbi:MAG: LuxR C-terminal-related transcriptional regulator [Adlercreutzia sp.]|nr:LuxR C-terminal-related transcriptional regulator [Adlercreutzia sp.]
MPLVEIYRQKDVFPVQSRWTKLGIPPFGQELYSWGGKGRLAKGWLRMGERSWELCARQWSFAAFLAVSLSFAPSGIPYLHVVGVSDGFNAFTCAALVTSCCSAALYVALRLLGRDFELNRSASLGAIGFIAGTLAFVLATSLSSIPDQLAILCGALAGSGGFMLCLLYARIYALLPFDEALVQFGAAMALAALASWLLYTSNGAVFLVLLVCLSVVAGIAPLIDVDCEGMADEGDVPEEARSPDGIGGFLRTVRASLGILGAPLLGLLVFGYVGVLVDGALIAETYGLQILGFAVSGAGLLILAKLLRRRPLFPFVYQTLIPFLAAGALVARVMVAEGVAAPALFDFGLHLMFGAVIVASFAALSAIERTGEFPGGVIVAIAYGLYCLVSLGGIGTVHASFHDVRFLSGVALTVWMAYFGIQALAPALYAWIRGYPDEERDGEPVAARSIADQLGERSRVVGEGYGLTQREIEILAFLARGHSSLFVSQTLLISDSTVRTHIKNIYKKLEVSSREELIALIDEPAGEEKPDSAEETGEPLADGAVRGRR